MFKIYELLHIFHRLSVGQTRSFAEPVLAPGPYVLHF